MTSLANSQLSTHDRLSGTDRIFGIPLERLLAVHGRAERPERVYRKIRPTEHHALSPEEAWVKPEA